MIEKLDIRDNRSLLGNKRGTNVYDKFIGEFITRDDDDQNNPRKLKNTENIDDKNISTIPYQQSTSNPSSQPSQTIFNMGTTNNMGTTIKKKKIKAGGDSELNFYINIGNIGDIKDLSSRVINIHTKLYKFESGEDDKDKLKTEIDELTNLLNNFNNSDHTNIDTIYMYVILSAYVTACEEYIKPEGAFKTEGWWFYDKEHFRQIVKVLKIKDILKKYNITEVSTPSNSSSESVVENLPPLPPNEKGNTISQGGKNKTLRVLYKTNSGRHTRYSRR